jgi:hypothetical protein
MAAGYFKIDQSETRRDETAPRLLWVDSVEKGSYILGSARHLSICETVFSFYLLSYGAISGFGCGVPPLMQRGHHNPSCKTGRRFVGPRSPDVFCQRLQVLHNSCEVELVARTGEPPQAHALESMVGLQVRKAHLDLLALVA